MAQLMKPPTLNFGLGHDLGNGGLSPELGSVLSLCKKNFSLSPSAPPIFYLPPPHVLSLSQKD